MTVSIPCLTQREEDILAGYRHTEPAPASAQMVEREADYQ